MRRLTSAGERPSSRAAEDRLPVATTLENTAISCNFCIFCKSVLQRYGILIEAAKA